MHAGVSLIGWRHPPEALMIEIRSMVTGFLLSLVLPFLWLARIRPYSLRHGGGYTPGANFLVSSWVDWQQASDTAKARGDRGMILTCRLFLAVHLIGALISFLLILAASFPR